MRRINIPTFHTELKAQGISSQRHAALVCPACKTVQSMASLVAAGATPEQAERMIGYSCEGRLNNVGPVHNNPTPERQTIRGCDWTLGGLFKIHKLEVEDEDGKLHPRFEVATPEQAKELEASLIANSPQKMPAQAN